MRFATYLINWDSETEAPVGCFEERAKQVGVLSEMEYDLLMSKESIDLITHLYEHQDELSHHLKVEIRHLYKNIQKKLLVPTEELIQYEMLLAKASPIWAKAKQTNDYSYFAPVLKDIIAFNKKYIQYVETNSVKGYDVLLDEYEEGSNIKFYDAFFEMLKKEIVPLVKKIQTKGYAFKDDFANRSFNIEKQKQFANYLLNVMCFDQSKGYMKESEHPFTSGFGTSDVRITNHYYENMVVSSIFSVIHEAGHATYEQQCNPALDETLIGGGTTMAMHESQSRFYENIIGRSYAFWKAHFPKLKLLFQKELEDVSLNDFYHYVNKVENSLIRTEADELTYPLHIMVRYDLEKMIMSDDIDINELPKWWNKLYKEYLGVEVPTDTLGILQDIHWAGGSFGYFPTYALGSAYAAQLLYAMKKEIDVEQVSQQENLAQVNLWLKEKVHQYGGTLTPEEILVQATGEKFNPKYYVEYLKEKYTKLYHL